MFGRVVCFMLAAMVPTESVEVRIEVRSQGQPLHGAKVTLDSKTVETDAHGVATLPARPGTVTVAVEAEHHAPLKKDIDVPAGSGQTVVLELEPQITEEEEVIV